MAAVMLLVFCRAAQPGEATLSTITVTATNALAAPVQQKLTELAKPVARVVAPGVDPFTVLNAFCGGTHTTDYFNAVKALNSDFIFGRSMEKRELLLPGCVAVSKNGATVKVLEGDTIETLIARTLGVKPNDVISVCDPTEHKSPQSAANCLMPAVEAIAAVNGGKRSGLDRLRPGQVVYLPTIARPTTIVLKEGVSAQAAIDSLNAAAAAAFANQPAKPFAALGIAPELHLMRPLDSDDAKVRGTACAPEAPIATASWPFDVHSLANALAESRKHPIYKKQTNGVAVIRIADTGVTGLESFFPREALAVNDKENKTPRSAHEDKDKNDFSNDYYGIDAQNIGDVSPYPDDPNKLHGTQVADWALGGSEFRTKHTPIYDLVKVSFAKIFWKRGGALSVNDSTMLVSMRAIRNHAMPRVVNFSVGSRDQQNTRTFEQEILNNRILNFLVVVAAGNDGVNLGKTPVYPAAYAGNGSVASQWIIAVGASGPDRRPARFSNHSRDRVDIFAPGCRMPFLYEGKQLLHGTSFAAPLVSFTAGLVYSLGVSDMRDVKMRIVSSVDYMPHLQEFSRYGGILNIERAISLFSDSVRELDLPDQRGKWITPSSVNDICEGEPPIDTFEQILSINTLKGKDGKIDLRIMYRHSDGRMAEHLWLCTPKGEGIQFQTEAQKPRPIPWSKVTTIVPAWFP